MSKAELEYHRRTATTSFNRAWDYLEMEHRTKEDDMQMLLLAHTSRHHWDVVGTAKNKAVGDWQLARVYAALGQPDLSLAFANASLSMCRRKGLSEITPSAYEGVARAYAVAKNAAKATENLTRARRLLDELDLDADDRKVFLDQFKDTQRLVDENL